MESLTDHLTGAFNRRAWDKLLDLEESRCKIYWTLNNNYCHRFK